MATRLAQKFTNNTIFVNNLPWTVGMRELKRYFEKFGPVTKSNVVFDKQTGLSKGYGFISFETEESLQSVFQSTDHTLEGKKLEIKYREN